MSLHHGTIEEGIADLAILDLLTAPTLTLPPALALNTPTKTTSNNLHLHFNLHVTAPNPVKPSKKHGFKRRDSELDPLLLAAATSCSPHVTRNHYTHDFFPPVVEPRAEGAWDWTNWRPNDAQSKAERKPRLRYVSLQAPKSKKLRDSGSGSLLRVDEKQQEKEKKHKNEQAGRESLLDANFSHLPTSPVHTETQTQQSADANRSSTAVVPRLQSTSSEVEVKCMARTRVPTPHGPVFLHLYHNNRDDKEHLAIVIDPAQLSESESPMKCPPIRSQSLDAVWSETETEEDRIIRGAYVGRLSATSQKPSTSSIAQSTLAAEDIPPPLIRIHSECFTGETIGSMRCDCGEQLDEAIRRISQPIPIASPSSNEPPATIPGRGAVIYLRQEGRGIGLLSKIRAYNLQDLGHDTVTANLMLGHKADERGYEVAAAILRDLSLGAGTSEGVKILTNNPDKMLALEKEGIRIVERVPMIPRTWQSHYNIHEHGHQHSGPVVAVKQTTVDTARIASTEGDKFEEEGVTMIGSRAVHGEDLDKYLRTKVLRMGHLLPLVEEYSGPY